MANESEYLVIGEFYDIESTRNAIVDLRAKGYNEELDVFSPFPEHSIEDALYAGRKRSPVRRFVLIGGLVGCLGAFLFTSWMSIDYPLRVSAKPLISIPAFVIIAFECTILLGALSNMLSMFHFSKIPDIFSNPGFRPTFTEGTFGITIRLPKDKSEAAKEELEQLGASAIEVKYVR